jgi:hypothetical protein
MSLYPILCCFYEDSISEILDLNNLNPVELLLLRQDTTMRLASHLERAKSLALWKAQPLPVLALLVGIGLATPPTAHAFDRIQPETDPQASEGCCGMDEDFTFRGYTVELWDEAPTISDLDCPDQDEPCLLNEADQISRMYRLQEVLVRRAALERFRHFGKEPLTVDYSTFR